MKFSPQRLWQRIKPAAAPCLRLVLPFFLTAATLRGGYAPFALALVASSGSGLAGLTALAGSLGGALVFLDFQPGLRQVAAATLIFAANSFFAGMRLYDRPWFRPLAAAGLTLVVQFAYLVDRSAVQWVWCFASLAVLACAGWCWRQLWTAPDSAAGALMTAAAAVALYDLLPTWDVSAGRLLAAGVVLWMAWGEALPNAAAWGACVGLLLDLSAAGGEPLLCAVLGTAAAAAALGRNWPWLLRGGVFCLAAGAAAVFFRAEAPAAMLLETGAAGLATSFLLRGRQGARQAEPLHRRELRSGGQPALSESAAALRALYDSFFRGSVPPPPENPSVLFDRAAEQVCRDCVLRQECWHKNYNSTYTAFNDACPHLLRNGRATARDFPAYFSGRCVRFPAFLSAVNTELRAYLTRRQYHRRLSDMRRQAQEQYRQLGEALGGAAVHAVTNVSAPMGYDVGRALRPRDGETLCGDHVEVFEVGQTLYLLLSDGMGSGQSAFRESAMTARLLRQFLDAGIEPGPALKTLNSALQLRGEEADSYTTIDLLALQRQSGSATVYKYGAAPSYVKRTGTVSRLTAASLPAGLQTQPPESCSLQLLPESYFVMVSDGVADAGEDEWLQDLLAGWHGHGAQELAELVLRQALERRGGDDDCAVLILHLGEGKNGARQV